MMRFYDSEKDMESHEKEGEACFQDFSSWIISSFE
jgi:hypothetical protein